MAYNNTTQASSTAIITPVLGAGSVASPYFWQINISQRLCDKVCVSNVPIFNPTFTLVGFSLVGTGEYMATIKVEGTIAYIPCCANACCTEMQVVSQTFSLPFYSATAPTAVSISTGATINSLYAPACKTCTRAFVSETPLELTIAA